MRGLSFFDSPIGAANQSPPATRTMIPAKTSAGHDRFSVTDASLTGVANATDGSPPLVAVLDGGRPLLESVEPAQT
jgi:hypothetical protein